jgi:hypothetical protein
MKRFSEILLEISKDKLHPDGTYVSVNLSKENSKELDEWVSNQKITNPIDSKEYHTTVVYSRKGIPEAKSHDMKLPIEASLKEWKLFDTQGGTKCLVAILDSKELQKHHLEYKTKFGATHDYPDYHPHVTVSYNFTGDLPTEKPSLNLKFDSKTFKALDHTFVPKKKDD